MKKLTNIIPNNYIEKLKAFKKLESELKELEKTFENDLKENLKRGNVSSAELDGVRFTYTKEYEKLVFDSAKFAAEHPNTYKKYISKKIYKDSIKKTIL